MITKNKIIRKAINVLEQNDIANFRNIFFTPNGNFSAISIEYTACYGIDKRADCFIDFIHRLFPLINKVRFNFSLLNQPNNRIVKYKGGWRMISEAGINISNIDNKKEFVYEKNGKLNFILDGSVSIEKKIILQKLFELIDNICFYIGEYNNIVLEMVLDERVNDNLIHNNYVLFFLGGNIENSNEIVIVKNSLMDLNNIVKSISES